MPTPPTIAVTTPRAKRRGVVLRAVSAVWLVAYAILGFGVPLLDSAEDHSVRFVAHWEDTSSSDCPAAHDTVCVACQFLAKGRALPAEGPDVLFLARAGGVAPHERDLRVAARSVSDGLSSRAPPAA